MRNPPLSRPTATKIALNDDTMGYLVPFSGLMLLATTVYSVSIVHSVFLLRGNGWGRSYWDGVDSIATHGHNDRRKLVTTEPRQIFWYVAAARNGFQFADLVYVPSLEVNICCARMSASAGMCDVNACITVCCLCGGRSPDYIPVRVSPLQYMELHPPNNIARCRVN